jgi:hypothetical protein
MKYSLNKKIIFKLFLLAVLFLSVLILMLSKGKIYPVEDLEYGVTFSKKKVADLGFDWKTVYIAMLDELRVKRLRIPAYWDEIEHSDGTYFWDDLDWLIAEAEKRNVKIILAMGGRLPRWPECHFPLWSENYPKAHREERILAYLKQTVLRYKSGKAVYAWQVENEPFLAHFGDCPTLDSHFLDMEIGLVKSLDNRPIVVTDSGELSFWAFAASRADIFGTTMYRDTYSKNLGSYVHYPINPDFFQFKKNIVKIIAHPRDWIVIELQAEPWGPKPYENLSQADRDRTMNPQKFKDILEFSRLAGFREFYLWGVEWWYWEREQGRPEMWEEAKGLFKSKLKMEN